uniref:Uncharacterized protein n=1 Tax=Pararge aegeria TaxID=116150 RepID=S4P7Z2_9NEOP
MLFFGEHESVKAVESYSQTHPFRIVANITDFIVSVIIIYLAIHSLFQQLLSVGHLLYPNKLCDELRTVAIKLCV